MITTGQIEFLLSAPMAASGYSMPGVPGNSLGNYVSTTQLSATYLDNLFPDLSGAQNAALQVDYQCVFIYNGNSADAMISPVAWLPLSLLGSGNTATFAVAADTTSPSAQASGSRQALSIGNPTQAPSGVTTWYAPSSTSAGGVALPNIPPLNVMAVWLRRTATGAGGLNQFVLDVTFDSLA